MAKLTINFKVPVTFFKERDMFVAHSPALDLSTAASTLGDAKKRFSEAVFLFFEELGKMGTTSDVLADLGWQRINSRWRPMTPVLHEIQEIQLTA